jgi:hypothetical protein
LLSIHCIEAHAIGKKSAISARRARFGFIGKLGGTEQIVRRNRSEEIAGVLPVLNISFYGAAKVLWN